MKEIKYRAWDTEKEVMAEVLSINLSDGEVRMMDEECRVWSAPAPYVCRLMQYIGLKDKNGKEIYDSDIVKVTWGSGKIVFYEVKYCESLGYHYLRDTKNKEDDDIICIYDYSQMDVIGNVFDNPELLKNK